MVILPMAEEKGQGKRCVGHCNNYGGCDCDGSVLRGCELSVTVSAISVFPPVRDRLRRPT
eukprot:scaffold35477_cov43-Cyclotella_meneghiniana.AAC.6